MACGADCGCDDTADGGGCSECIGGFEFSTFSVVVAELGVTDGFGEGYEFAEVAVAGAEFAVDLRFFFDAGLAFSLTGLGSAGGLGIALFGALGLGLGFAFGLAPTVIIGESAIESIGPGAGDLVISDSEALNAL